MIRIMILGVSAGVGKSTFAKQLGVIMKIPVYHLDSFFWKPGWVQASPDEFAAAQEQIVCHDEWIIEGNYSNTHEIRATRADAIIYLELPRRVCLYRVFKRWLTNIGKSRSDMGPGCPEKIDYAFIRFIWTTYHRRKNTIEARVRSLNQLGTEKTFIQLKSKREITAYLRQLELEQSMQ